MIKKTITFTDYDGNQRTDDYYFNLSKAELIEMQFTTVGGMQRLLEDIARSHDNKRTFEMFKDIILRAYGKKSPDGIRFIKSKELSEEFEQTEAYSELILEFFEDGQKAADFINGVIPSDLAAEIAKRQENGEILVDGQIVKAMPKSE